MAAITAPGGRVILGKDELGRVIVTNFPPTLPSFFKTFCALNAAVEAIIAGDERLTFAELDEISDRIATITADVVRSASRLYPHCIQLSWCVLKNESGDMRHEHRGCQPCDPHR